MNRLYLIKQTLTSDYDTAQGFVMSAKSSVHALRLIVELHAFGDEGSEVWSPGNCNVEYLGETHAKNGIILRSFKAG